MAMAISSLLDKLRFQSVSHWPGYFMHVYATVAFVAGNRKVVLSFSGML